MATSSLWSDENAGAACFNSTPLPHIWFFSAPLGTWQHELSSRPSIPPQPNAYAQYDPRYMGETRASCGGRGV
eukprot:757560-Hanusia_phi.AAC.4